MFVKDPVQNMAWMPEQASIFLVHWLPTLLKPQLPACCGGSLKKIVLLVGLGLRSVGHVQGMRSRSRRLKTHCCWLCSTRRCTTPLQQAPGAGATADGLRGSSQGQDSGYDQMAGSQNDQGMGGGYGAQGSGVAGGY